MAAHKLGQGFVDFFMKNDRFRRGAKQVAATLATMQAGMQRAAGFARNMLLVGAGAAYGLIKLSAKQADAEAKLAAVLRATGGAAGYTAKELIAQAAALQKVTTYGDETIINAQAIMATFKNVRGDVFQAAMESILDMNAVLGGDLKMNVVQLGKALNDPIIGVGALGRVGVSFTEVQKEQIKQFVKTNQLGRAQAVIMKELQDEFGGAARAMAKTDAGRFRQSLNRLSDAGERFGKALQKALSEALPHIERLSQWVQNLSKQQITALIGKVKTLAKVLLGVWALGKLATMISMVATLRKSFMMLGIRAMGVVGAISAMAMAYFALKAAAAEAEAAIDAVNDSAKGDAELNRDRAKAAERYERAVAAGNTAEQLIRLREMEEATKRLAEHEERYGDAMVALGKKVGGGEMHVAESRRRQKQWQEMSLKHQREADKIEKQIADRRGRGVQFSPAVAVADQAKAAAPQRMQFVGLEEQFKRLATAGKASPEQMQQKQVTLAEQQLAEQTRGREVNEKILDAVKRAPGGKVQVVE